MTLESRLEEGHSVCLAFSLQDTCSRSHEPACKKSGCPGSGRLGEMGGMALGEEPQLVLPPAIRSSWAGSQAGEQEQLQRTVPGLGVSSS